MRVASRWNTNANINIPAPAIAHAISAPATPVSRPKRRGSRKTPDPIIDPTTMAVSVGRLTLSDCVTADSLVAINHLPALSVVDVLTTLKPVKP